MKKIWEEEHLKILIENYSTKKESELIELLPSYSKYQIRNKAKKLVLKKKQKQV